MKTEAAKTAAAIKAELKTIGISAKVSSKNYSMGDHVNVSLTDIHPDEMIIINNLLSKYQYGHFDGMIDLYEDSNRRDDIPQTKFLFINNEISQEIKEAAYQIIRAGFGGYEDAPDTLAAAQGFYSQRWQGYAPQLVYRMLHDSKFCDKNNLFKKILKEKAA